MQTVSEKSRKKYAYAEKRCMSKDSVKKGWRGNGRLVGQVTGGDEQGTRDSRAKIEPISTITKEKEGAKGKD